MSNNFLDLTGAKESSYGLLPDGTYTVRIDDASVKETKDGTGEYINCKFKVEGGDHDGRFIFSTFNIKNKNEKAVEIGLGQLKSFMRCAGFTDFKLVSVTDLVGYPVLAVVKTKRDDFGEKSVISYFKPLNDEPKQGAPKKEATPF